MADYLKARQKEYRSLLRGLLKRLRKLRRQLEKQQRERATRMREPAEGVNEDAAGKLMLARQQLQEGGASSSSAGTPLSTAALESFRLAMLGRPSRKGGKRRRRQAKKSADAERPRN